MVVKADLEIQLLIGGMTVKDIEGAGVGRGSLHASFSKNKQRKMKLSSARRKSGPAQQEAPAWRFLREESMLVGGAQALSLPCAQSLTGGCCLRKHLVKALYLEAVD